MATPTRFARPTYTPAQLLKFYARIQLPQSIITHITSPTFEPDLSTLATMQLYTVSSIPFECLSLHYSPSPKITISPDFLFQKMVDREDGREGNGRGGYCMENNTLFGTVLRSIGYAAYPVGCRVNSDTNEKEGEEAVYYPWCVLPPFSRLERLGKDSDIMLQPCSVFLQRLIRAPRDLPLIMPSSPPQTPVQAAPG